MPGHPRSPHDQWRILSNHGTNHPPYGGFLKWWYPTTMGFPTKNDHFGVFLGYHHLRKHPYVMLHPTVPKNHCCEPLCLKIKNKTSCFCQNLQVTLGVGFNEGYISHTLFLYGIFTYIYHRFFRQM